MDSLCTHTHTHVQNGLIWEDETKSIDHNNKVINDSQWRGGNCFFVKKYFKTFAEKTVTF